MEVTNTQVSTQRQRRTQLLSFQARRRERGATIFVVLTVMTLLTAVGVYAARAASLVDRAAGFDRQFLQTHYVSALGTLAAATELGGGSGALALDRMGKSREACRATRGMVADSDAGRCLRYSMREIQERVNSFYPTQALLDNAKNGPPAEPGSLGPYSPATGAALEGNFVVELSDRGYAAPVAGSDLSGSGTLSRYARVTATAMGQVTPFTGDTACVEGAAAVTGIETTRAYVEFGPVE